jgi:succinyl-diaminopimelate desuccinylase
MSPIEMLARIDEAELVALARDLIRIPSVIKPGDPTMTEAAVAMYIAGWLEKQDFEVEVQEVAPGRPNVLGRLGDSGAGPTLLLEGHTDVVTEGDPRAWAYPPAAATIKRSGVRLRGALMVGALVDEEGGMLGAHHLCATRAGRELSAAIICEPEDNELCLEQRGVVWARVIVRGRMAHGAMPEAGVNPIIGLAEVVRQARALERRLRRLCQRSRHVRPPTVTPTIVQAPVEGLPQSNVIPATGAVTLDVRLTPGPDAAAIAGEIDRACRDAAAAAQAEVTWSPLSGYRLATRVDRGERLVQAMEDAVRQATGRRARFGGVPGSTDGTILRTQLGIPIVTCGPGNRLVPHQVNEYVEIGQLLDAARIYVASALNFLETT